MSRKPGVLVANCLVLPWRPDRPAARCRPALGADNSVSACRHNLLTPAFCAWNRCGGESKCRPKPMKSRIYGCFCDGYLRFGLGEGMVRRVAGCDLRLERRAFLARIGIDGEIKHVARQPPEIDVAILDRLEGVGHVGRAVVVIVRLVG